MRKPRRTTLWNQVAATTAQALGSGALQPIPTACEFVADGGVRFLVRVVANLARKDRARAAEMSATAAVRPDPFLPYDPALYVADASPTHVCLLNKFNVVEHHLLIVTRHFEHQDTPLTPADWEAWWACLTEYEGLGFYNGGTVAGASQTHKHLQLVPLPLAPSGNAVKDSEFENTGRSPVAGVARLRGTGRIDPKFGESGYEPPTMRFPNEPRIPLEPLMELPARPEQLGCAPRLPFAHVLARLDPARMSTPAHTAARTHLLYRRMLGELGLTITAAPEERVSRPYNLLVTRQWMLLVPRQRECLADISLNALAFAGALLVRDQSQLEVVKRHGPMAALEHVAGPR